MTDNQNTLPDREAIADLLSDVFGRHPDLDYAVEGIFDAISTMPPPPVPTPAPDPVKAAAGVPNDEPHQIVCTGEAGSDVWNAAFGTWEADEFGIDSDEPIGEGERLFVNRRLYEALKAENAALRALQGEA